MLYNIQPRQITIFDTLQDRNVIERELKGLAILLSSIASLENLFISWQEFLRANIRWLLGQVIDSFHTDNVHSG